MKAFITLLTALVAALAGFEAAQAGNERLVYKIEVTALGTRSQGWHGTLYEEDSQALNLPPGWKVTTGTGTFVSVACGAPFYPCGMIHTDMRAWMIMGAGNDLSATGYWEYRLYVTAEGTHDEGWRGELVHDDVVVPAPSNRVPLQAPMGPFRWWNSPGPWGRHGWFHASWVNNGDGPD